MICESLGCSPRSSASAVWPASFQPLGFNNSIRHPVYIVCGLVLLGCMKPVSPLSYAVVDSGSL